MHVNELRFGDVFTTPLTRLHLETGEPPKKVLTSKVRDDQAFLYLGSEAGGWGYLYVRAVLLFDCPTDNKIVFLNVSDRQDDFTLLNRGGVFEIEMPDYSVWHLPRILLDILYGEFLERAGSLGLVGDDGTLPDPLDYGEAPLEVLDALHQVRDFPYSVGWSSLRPYAVRIKEPETQCLYEEYWDELKYWPQEPWKGR